MNRPYIFCHMITSIDGKIDGTHKSIPERGENALDFYEIAFGENSYYNIDGWLSGRGTSDNITGGLAPELEPLENPIPEGDFVVKQPDLKYYVSIDPSGKLGWTQNFMQYRDTKAQILEVLTNRASDEYKQFLRKLNIPYIIVGNENIDYEILLDKLKNFFDINVLMLGGGGVLNWSFIQAGVCDELSMLIAPYADGSNKTHALFQMKEGLSEDIPVSFELEHVERREHGGVWLRYKVKK